MRCSKGPRAARRRMAEKERNFLPEKKKMEALGRLSGKVAHDLNNILGAIEGYATLAAMAAAADDPMKQDMEEIRKAVAKAAAFNKQLLVFSGRQLLRKEPCGVNAIIGDLLKAAAGVQGEDFKVELSLQPDLPVIVADAGQLRQALSNLLTNAREAMPEGGTITISSSLLRLEGAGVSSPKPDEAGTEFIKISVKDAGAGISGEALERLFEPAFAAGKKAGGTGLGGLALVYGVARQHNGWVEAASAPGRGSEFFIFLPAGGPAAAAAR